VIGSEDFCFVARKIANRGVNLSKSDLHGPQPGMRAQAGSNVSIIESAC
jgi:hypothetical protein